MNLNWNRVPIRMLRNPCKVKNKRNKTLLCSGNQKKKTHARNHRLLSPDNHLRDGSSTSNAQLAAHRAGCSKAMFAVEHLMQIIPSTQIPLLMLYEIFTIHH